MLKSISVVIPNYNGIALLEKNIPPLIAALQNSGTQYEIIIADDASVDASVDFLLQTYPEIKVLVNDRNSGFAVTMNKGIFAAKNDLLLSLNSDVVLIDDYFDKLFGYFDVQDTFAVAGKTIGLSDNIEQDTAKYPECSMGNISGTTNYRIKGINSHIAQMGLPSFFTSGANSLYDREKLVFLGGFTELYSPFYGEDLDLSLKAWRLGWKSYFEEKAVCRHPASTTIKKYNRPQQIRLVSRRNKMIMHFSHLGGINWVIFLFRTIFKLLFSWVKWDLTYYKAFNNFIHLLPAVIQFRKDLNEKAVFLNRKLLSLNNVVASLQREIKLRGDIEVF